MKKSDVIFFVSQRSFFLKEIIFKIHSDKGKFLRDIARKKDLTKRIF